MMKGNRKNQLEPVLFKTAWIINSFRSGIFLHPSRPWPKVLVQACRSVLGYNWYYYYFNLQSIDSDIWMILL